MNMVVNIRPSVGVAPRSAPVERRARRQVEESGADWPAVQAHSPDYGLLVLTLALLCIGIVMVYSASLVAGYKEYHDDAYFFQRQLMWSGLGVGVMLLFTRIPYRFWRRFSLIALVASVGLLVAVLLPGFGSQALGATRWIQIGGLQIGQPSELCKLTLVIYMADWLSRKGERVKEFGYGLVPFALLLAAILGLIMKQPDMGTAIVIGATALAIFFVSGASLLQLVPLGGVAVVGFLGLALTSNYRHGRITAFLDPWSDPSNAGYHVVQSLIALGDGGIRGLGLGVSRQKFGLLPFPYTDSIFAVIGEELGLVGSALVLVLFLLLAYRGLRASRRAPDAFGGLLAIGVSCQMVIQAFLNIAVVTSTVPFTGITLPLVSYGGSSMLVSFAAMGILLNVTKFSRSAKETVGAEEAEAAAGRGRNRWPHLPRAGRAGSDAQPAFARS